MSGKFEWIVPELKVQVYIVIGKKGLHSTTDNPYSLFGMYTVSC